MLKDQKDKPNDFDTTSTGAMKIYLKQLNLYAKKYGY